MDESRTDVVKRLTKLSEIGTPPEGCVWWAPFACAACTFLTVLLVLVLLLLSPILLLGILVRAVAFCRVKYHRDPAELRIAVIGGGWGGLQCASRLLELGVKNVRVFERYDDVGGTWHPNLSYHGLQLHAPLSFTSFDKFPYSSVKDEQHGKTSADETQCFIKRFVHERGLDTHIVLNANVTNITYDSTKRAGTLTVEDSVSGESRKEGLFDLVIWASTASAPRVPTMAGMFQGKQFHTSDLKTEDFDSIRQQGQRVLVVGGGKSACDMVINFKRASHSNIAWLYRKPYLFFKYESLADNRTIVQMLRGVSIVAGLMYSTISLSLAGLCFWGSGTAWTYGLAHNDWSKFVFGVMCPRQRRDIEDVTQTIGNPVRLLPKGVELEDGTTIECDVIIWATGYQSGIDKMSLQKDGQAFTLQDSPLFNHFIVPQFPVFASTTAFFTTFGPVRGANAGDMAVYHLCVRRELSECEMERRANRNLSKSTAIRGFVWNDSISTLRHFALTDVDLVLNGIIAFHDFLWHVVEMFVLSRQNMLRLDILPNGRQDCGYTAHKD